MNKKYSTEAVVIGYPLGFYIIGLTDTTLIALTGTTRIAYQSALLTDQNEIRIIVERMEREFAHLRFGLLPHY